MKNVTIQISDDLYEKLQRYASHPYDDFSITFLFDLSEKLHAAIIRALLPKEDA